jgi:rubredoxin
MTICPRCRATAASQVAASPVPGRWTVQACGVCHYVWRSSEPAAATDPEHYPADFRLDGTNLSAPRVV